MHFTAMTAVHSHDGWFTAMTAVHSHDGWFTATTAVQILSSYPRQYR